MNMPNGSLQTLVDLCTVARTHQRILRALVDNIKGPRDDDNYPVYQGWLIEVINDLDQLDYTIFKEGE